MSATDKPDARTNHSSNREQATAEVNRDKQREAWAVESREAIVAYNKDVDEHGVFSDGLRSF